MPTGYTAPVGDGKITTLRQFALLCARGMGACINMRDEPLDAPIPERFEPQTKYYDERLAAARAALADLSALTAEDCEARAKDAHAASLANHYKYEAERDAENKRYRDMLKAVDAWETDAEGIKQFMHEQLSMSIFAYDSEPPEPLSGKEWLERSLAKAARDIGYYEAERAKEVMRTEGRNRWLAALRASLPEEVA